MEHLGIHNFLIFLSAGILLNLTPGPDTMFIVSRSLSLGRLAGVVSCLGISTGCLVHTLMAALGLSAILATSTVAFAVVKYAGAAYLILLGLRILFGKAGPSGAAAPGASITHNYAVIFRQGVLTNVLNPKVALFFLAFLPQFIDPQAPAKVLAFTLLGLTFILTGTTWCLIVAWCAGGINRLLRRNASISSWLHRLEGTVFLSLGIKIALTPR